MTFSIPDDVADRLASEVPSAEQSLFVVKLLEHRLPARRLTEEQLAAACDAVNADPELNLLVDAWQTVNDPIEDLWNESASR